MHVVMFKWLFPTTAGKRDHLINDKNNNDNKDSFHLSYPAELTDKNNKVTLSLKTSCKLIFLNVPF